MKSLGVSLYEGILSLYVQYMKVSQRLALGYVSVCTIITLTVIII